MKEKKIGADTPEGLLELQSLSEGESVESKIPKNNIASIISDISHSIRIIEEVCIPEGIRRITNK